MTNSWTDIKNTDLVLIMGGNAAEAHPCGFKWVTEAMQHRKAKLVVVDPRFTRSAAVADVYAPIRVGTDIAFLGGVINYLLTNDKIHHDYVRINTDATFLTKEGYAFENGLFSGYDEARRSYDKSTWGYQLGDDGFVKVDETMQDPRCVFQQLKKHYSRYTPEQVSRITGTPKDQFLKVCELLAGTAGPDKVMTICYALGWTQHSVGSQNIRTMAMIQLLLGNMGRPAGRRRQCAARPCQRAGHHRHERLLGGAVGLPVGAHRRRRHAGPVPGRAHAQAAAPEPDGVHAELPEVVHQPDEVLLRERGHARERLRL